MSSLSWDQYFMLQAMLVAFKSKDPNTKVGSVLVDSTNHILSTGYNGMVAGIKEPWDDKYKHVIHSEANAILHKNTNLNGSKLYVTHFPCNECSKLIAASGIKEVVFLKELEKWKQSQDDAKEVFDLANIKYRQMNISIDLINEVFTHLLLTKL